MKIKQQSNPSHKQPATTTASRGQTQTALQSNVASIAQDIMHAPSTLSVADIALLQDMIGNHTVTRLLRHNSLTSNPAVSKRPLASISSKFSVGQPTDVVQSKFSHPTNSRLIQRESDSDEESDSWWNTFKEGAAGLAYGTMQGLTPGGFLAPSPDSRSRAFEFFRGAGQIATGVAETTLGVGGEAVGIGLDATGVGAIAGVPLNIASAVVAANGVTSVVGGMGTLLNAMSMGSGNGGGGRRSGGKKQDIRQIEDIAREFKMTPEQRREYGDFVEMQKASGNTGTTNKRGDFTYQELRQLAREFLGQW